MRPPHLMFHPKPSRGFTLIELLVVIALIAALMAMAGPAVNALQGAANLTKASEDLKSVFEQARAHAMANNNYVYVGVVEIDEADTSTNKPLPSGGAIMAGIAASKTGTAVRTDPITTDAVSLVSRPFKLQNVVMTDVANDTGGLVNRKTGENVVALMAANTPGLKWPGSGGVAFDKVIEFDPQGVARLARSHAATTIDGYIEIPLRQKTGGQDNAAVIQIDGITGVARLYRP
jgi:prepilin-type N-terminal cleavage/methylation domain-containing protein